MYFTNGSPLCLGGELYWFIEPQIFHSFLILRDILSDDSCSHNCLELGFSGLQHPENPWETICSLCNDKLHVESRYCSGSWVFIRVSDLVHL